MARAVDPARVPAIAGGDGALTSAGICVNVPTVLALAPIVSPDVADARPYTMVVIGVGFYE